jgi:hypothetical protein
MFPFMNEENNENSVMVLLLPTITKNLPKKSLLLTKIVTDVPASGTRLPNALSIRIVPEPA